MSRKPAEAKVERALSLLDDLANGVAALRALIRSGQPVTAKNILELVEARDQLSSVEASVTENE